MASKDPAAGFPHGELDAIETGDEDVIVLAKLGYKQVLYRTWGTVTTVALTISAMSTLTSISASMGTGLRFGGSAVCVWGWVAVSMATVCIGLGMAELASAYPTSGGMYYWMNRLAGKRFGAWACWVTGWLNLLGQIAAVSAVAALAAGLTATMITMATGLNGGTPCEIDEKGTFGIFAGYIILNTIINSLGLSFLTLMTQIGAVVNIAGVILLTIIVPAMAKNRASAAAVFTQFDTKHANEAGITNPFYIAILGLLLPAYSYTGVDGPVHMAEEVHGSEMGPPKAIMSGIAIMFVGGLSMIIALLFSMPSLAHVLDEDNEAGGEPIQQILYDVFKDYGNPSMGVALQIIPILGTFFCLVATTTYVARIMFCYSRDHAVPFSRVWQKVDKRTRTPQYALWAVCFCALLLGLPMLGSETAFNAILSLSTISLIVAYVAPIALRITIGAKYFEPGPFHLGKWAYPIGAVATFWACFATVIFSLPTELPVDAENLNYASVALVGTFLLSNLWFWCPVIGAHKWFTGPYRTIDDEGDSVMEIEGAMAHTQKEGLQA